MKYKAADGMPEDADKIIEPEAATGNKQTVSRLRLYILVGLLSILCVAHGAMQLDQWRLHGELAELAEEIVAEFNKSNPLEVGAEPQIRTDCEITAVREYLFFGKATGKIVFRFADRVYTLENGLFHQVSTNSARVRLGSLQYIYVRESGAWRLLESYQAHGD